MKVCDLTVEMLVENYRPEDDEYLLDHVPAPVYRFVQQLVKQFKKEVIEHHQGDTYMIQLGDGLGDDISEQLDYFQEHGLRDTKDFEFAGSHGHDDDMTNDLIYVTAHALGNPVMRQFIQSNVGPITARA